MRDHTDRLMVKVATDHDQNILTYQFVVALLWDHGLYLADTVAQGQLGGDDELGFRLALVAILILLTRGLLLLGVEHLVVGDLQDETLPSLELLNRGL